MQLSEYSRNKILETFAQWHVPKDYADPLYNYLVHGFEPGSFFTSVLANDWHMAIQRSHPANTIETLQALSSWIKTSMPSTAHGSYPAVEQWCRMTGDSRRLVLEKVNLIYTAKDETWMTLKGLPSHEPFLF
jgi:hypothetical protein